MGTIASKPTKQKLREENSGSWYAPVSRSISAPIHFKADEDEDDERENYQFVSLTTSSHGFHTMEKTTYNKELLDTGGFARILHHSYSCSPSTALPSQEHPSQYGTFHGSSKLKTVEEAEEVEEVSMASKVESVNTQVLMEGLECKEEAIHKQSDGLFRRSPLRSLSNRLDYDYKHGHNNYSDGKKDVKTTYLDAVQRSPLGSGLCRKVPEAPPKNGNNTWDGSMASFDLQPDASFASLSIPRASGDTAVLYFTSLRCIRRTFDECCAAKQILRGLGVFADERDVWMHSKFRDELTQLMGGVKAPVPRLFIKGRDIGGFEDLKRLHEEGVLATLVVGLRSSCRLGLREACPGCADVRFVPCLTCSGSCKVLDTLDRATRCDQCNENGLIMCPICT